MADYELAPAARQDILEIAIYTLTRWGDRQAARYERELEGHLVALGRGGVRSRAFLGDRPELRVSRCGHHFVFSELRDGDCPLVLAVLHENMDLMRRLRDRLAGAEEQSDG